MADMNADQQLEQIESSMTGDQWHALTAHRGGCNCLVSPPCSRCSNPLTLREALDLGWIEEHPACPFAVGDRVRNMHTNWPDATVTALTEQGGFMYAFDAPHSLGPRHGTIHGGEVFAAGVDSWERVPSPTVAGRPDTGGWL